MGFFKKIFGALKKTKDAFAKKISALFTGDKIGEEFYENLTDVLISSDVSYSTAEEIVEDLRDRMIEERTADQEYVIQSWTVCAKNSRISTPSAIRNLTTPEPIPNSGMRRKISSTSKLCPTCFS